MLGKLYHTIAVASIAITLAGGALIGVLYGTGRLTPERIDTIADTLRGAPGEGAEETENSETAGDEQEAEQIASARSEEEIRQQRRENQLRRALGERAHRDLVAQRELLDGAMQHLITEQERFEERQAVAKAALERRRGEASDEGFEKEKKIVSKLPSKLAKEHLVRKWAESPADAVRLLNALSESTSKRILGQMKTPEEMRVMHELLERLSDQTVDPPEPASGKT